MKSPNFGVYIPEMETTIEILEMDASEKPTKVKWITQWYEGQSLNVLEIIQRITGIQTPVASVIEVVMMNQKILSPSEWNGKVKAIVSSIQDFRQVDEENYEDENLEDEVGFD